MSYGAIKVFAFSLVALFVLLVLGCQAFQRSVLFFPSHHSNDNGFTRWVSGGETIGFAREVASPGNVWLFLHGNGGQAADRQYAMYAFDARDSIFILEYPGYGQRAGTPSRKGFDAAARAGYADLRARFSGKRVCVFGESLGSGPASMLTHETPAPDKLVLIVPFDSVKAVGHEKVPWAPSSLLLAGTWDNVEALADWRGPTEIFGAVNDEVIPVNHARHLAQTIPQAQYHELQGNHGWANQPGVAVRCP